jgi:hypothetical protein
MIPDTPTAERTRPTAKAVMPRITTALGAFESPMLDAKIEKETIARIGGNADARDFLQEAMDVIEPIVRNRMGRVMIRTVKNP